MIPDYIANELAHLSESSKEDVDKLAEKLNIETENLKNKIIQIFNEDINKLNDNEISFYYSVYLYLINQEKRELEQQNEVEEKERVKKIFSQIKEYDKKEYNETHLKELLSGLNLDELGEVVKYLYYKKNKYIKTIDDRFISLIKEINKDIVIDIILDNYRNLENNLFEKLFLHSYILRGKNKLIEFLELIDYETYIKFKPIIFVNNSFRTTQFFDILKKYIEYTKTENFEKYFKGNLEKDFNRYYHVVKDNYKGKAPNKRYPRKYYETQK